MGQNDSGGSFLGIPANQVWHDLFIWEQFFNTYPVKTVVELGTDKGGMSLFLALQSYQHGAQFYTFDHDRWFDFSKGVPALLNLASTYRWFDLFSEKGQVALGNLIATCEKPLAIFFDDGNKPREWKTYAPLTSPGDYCIVHDWGKEFMPEDVLDVPVERILCDWCDARDYDWKSMWFRRI